MLTGKKAIVTGGSRGIGFAIAKRFLEHGVSSLAIVGTNSETGQAACDELKTFLKDKNGKVVFAKINVASPHEIEAGFKGLIDEFGGIDILVNNAGVTRDTLLMKMSEEEWDAVLDTNLKSVYSTCKAVMRTMLKARSGKIINITSVVGLMGNAGQTNYAASKAGIIGFTKSLAKELASRNICVNNIAPGFIQTAMTDVLNPAQKEQLLNQIPLQRLGRPEEIADAALFLASSLSNYITGQVLTVDGGMVMS